MAKFKLPTDISKLDNEALAAAVEEALAAFADFAEIPDEEVTDEQFAEMTALREFTQGARAELGQREQAAEVRAQELAAIRAEMSADEAPAGDEEEAPGEEEAPAEEEAPFEEEEAPAPAQAATAGKRQSFAVRAAKAAPKQGQSKLPSKPQGGSLTAAAGVSGFAAGHKFNDFADASEVILSRLRSLPNDGRAGRIRDSALVIEAPANKFTQKDRNISEMLLQASSESRLSGGSLVAAGGWGAPSEHTLDFCKLENLDGLINLPEVTITRGGVQWTKGPTFADVNESELGFWDMDEATAEAGIEQKTFIRPEVPDFLERRLRAVGAGMEAGLLLRQGWPELVQRYADLLGTAFTLKQHKRKIALIEEYVGAAVNVANGFGNAIDLIHAVELVAIGERQRNAMGTKATLEALIPHWAKAVIRADLANRKGIDSINITDAQIDSYFTSRGIKPQWLNGFQDIPLDPTTGIALTYPDTVRVIMYPAGTYVVGSAPVISLDTIYDSVLLKKNDYVHLFMEQGLLMTNPCGEGRHIQLPSFVATGARAADVARAAGLFNATV
jgi:hypothetical protein